MVGEGWYTELPLEEPDRNFILPRKSKVLHPTADKYFVWSIPRGCLCCEGDLHTAAGGWSSRPWWLSSRSKFKCLFSWTWVCIIGSVIGLVAYREWGEDVLEQPGPTECSSFLPTAVGTVEQGSCWGRGGCIEQLISRKGLWQLDGSWCVQVLALL